MIVEHANHLASQGHDVFIFINVIDTVFQLKAKVKQVSTTGTKLDTVLAALFQKRDCDVLIADIIIMVLFLSLRNKSRVLYFAQDYDESYYRNFFSRMLIRFVYFFCLRILRVPVIAVSEELGQLLRERYNADVTVVPNGVDVNLFYPDRDSSYLSLKGESKVILLFARSDYRKGFDIALKVLTAFKDEINNNSISVWTVGETTTTPFKIRSFGFVSPEILRKILSCADVLLYPTRHEGLPLFVLESMACGCPVITTEAVPLGVDGESIVKHKIEDVDACVKALRKVLSDSSLKNKLKSNGLLESRKYSLSKSVLRFESELQNFLKDRVVLQKKHGN